MAETYRFVTARESTILTAEVRGRNTEARLTILTEDGSVLLRAPFAPGSTTHGDRAQRWAPLDRPGRRPILSSSGPSLPTEDFTLLFAPPPDKPWQGVMPEINVLERLASSNQRLVLRYGPPETGLWRMTALTWTVTRRHPETSTPIQATAEVQFTRASDFSPQVGPVTGGHNNGGGGGHGDGGGPGTLPPSSGGFPNGGGGGGGRYTVKEGDTLHRISVKVYGSPKHWRAIADANGIRNPNRDRELKRGRVLKIPVLGGTGKL